MSRTAELPILPVSNDASLPGAPDASLVAETTSPEVIERIHALKQKLKDQVVILGHHYQRDDVVQFADRTGDSFELARFAASAGAAKPYILFCGVHFMAETADVLSADSQRVILPDLKAGCSMSDMARAEQVYDAWEALGEYLETSKICPITYMNSSAAIKAFCGEHGGAVSTSSNNKAIFEWAFAQGFEKILFFPDQHLGRNTAYYQMGIPLDEILLYDQTQPMGGLTPESLRNARVLLWRGHCSVHQHFQPSHPDIMRALYPGIQVMVHPECSFEVVRKADKVGSTAYIVKTVETAPAGSRWAIGTEHHLVNRLRQAHPEQFITTLAPYACECATMYRISPESLLVALEAIDEGRVYNEITVAPDEKRWARVALERMLEITTAAG